MNKKQFLKDYLTFSKKERIAIYCILFILVFGCFYPSFFADKQANHSIIIDTTLSQLIDTVQQVQIQDPYTIDNPLDAYEPTKANSFTKGPLFGFDPNTLEKQGWVRLGLKERTIQTIMNYRNKGGKFYKPEDLKKIWGLPAGFYEHVAQHIQIKSIIQNSSFTAYPQETISSLKKKERKPINIDINQADTIAFISLPGIGSKLALRIVNFREKLGGFYSIEQIKETYGLPDSTFQQLKPYLQLSLANIKRLNINLASKDELKSHPYIKWQLANLIIEYRNQHGRFNNLQDLKNIHLIDDATFSKIVPYVKLE